MKDIVLQIQVDEIFKDSSDVNRFQKCILSLSTESLEILYESYCSVTARQTHRQSQTS